MGYILIFLLLGLRPAWAEECLQEKIAIENLKQQNAQLQFSNAQLQFAQSKEELERLEALKKGEAPQGEVPMAAPTPPPTPE